jgi:predicted nucleotidyltransferase
VEFVIIGGWSMILQGSGYLTSDLDICFSRGRTNLKRLAAALAPFHPRLRDIPAELPFVWDETTLRNGTIFTLTTELGTIDLLAEVAGIGSPEEVKCRSIEVEAFERRVYTLSLEALIDAKRAAGRSKDLAHIHELESLREAQESDSES